MISGSSPSSSLWIEGVGEICSSSSSSLVREEMEEQQQLQQKKQGAATRKRGEASRSRTPNPAKIPTT